MNLFRISCFEFRILRMRHFFKTLTHLWVPAPRAFHSRAVTNNAIFIT